MNATAARVGSPCVGLCRLDQATRWCVGCGRTGAEIGAWRAASDGERASVLAVLPERLAALDRPPRRIGGADAARAALAPVLSGTGAAVAAGCHGAVAEFVAAPGVAVGATWDGNRLLARTRGGRLELALTDGFAVFAAAGGEVVLAVPDDGARLPVAEGLRRLGTDPGGEALFDLGLGLGEMRFMVRTGDTDLVASLAALEGAPLGRVLAEAGAALVAASPTRIVETLAARIEVEGPMPISGDRSPRAPRTRLQPAAIALRRLTPPGIAAPPGFLVVAVVRAAGR